MRSLTTALLLAQLPVLGCGFGVEGDFDGFPFHPGPTMMAVADRNALLMQNGAVVPVRRADGDQRLHMLFTAAPVDGAVHWSGARADELSEIVRALATHDGLLLRDIPLARFARGDALEAVLEEGQSSGDFTFAVGMAWPDGAVARAIGSRVRLTVVPRALELSVRGGSLAGDITIVRDREAGQDTDTATGRFTLRFSAALDPERLTEANLAVAAPVLLCMQAAGPGLAAMCAHEEPEPIIDETGVTR